MPSSTKTAANSSEMGTLRPVMPMVMPMMDMIPAPMMPPMLVSNRSLKVRTRFKSLVVTGAGVVSLEAMMIPPQ